MPPIPCDPLPAGKPWRGGAFDPVKMRVKKITPPKIVKKQPQQHKKKPSPKKTVLKTGKRAARKIAAKHGCIIASDGVGNSARLWWDPETVKKAQLGQPGEKMPKHGGWNPRVLNYLDTPGYITSMNCGIALQDVWILKFRDGLEIPLHRSIIYKSLYPQLRCYYKGLLNPKAPKGLGCSLLTLSSDLKQKVASFLFHDAKPSLQDKINKVFLQSSGGRVATEIVREKKTAKSYVFAVKKADALEGLKVDKKKFIKDAEKVVPGGFVEKLAKILGETGEAGWKDVLQAHKTTVGSGQSNTTTTTATTTTDKNSPTAKQPSPSAAATSTSSSPKKPAAKSALPTLAERKASAAAAAAAKEKSQQKDNGGVIVVAAGDGKKPVTPPAAKKPTEVKKDIAPQPPASTTQQSAVVEVTDHVVHRTEAKLPVMALQEQCVRLTKRIKELESRHSEDTAVKSRMREAIRYLEWTQQHQPGSNPSQALTTTTTPNLGDKITVTVKCMASKMSRRRVPPGVVEVYENSKVEELLCEIERMTGVPVGRQVVAMVENGKKVRRVVAGGGKTLKTERVAHGATLLVAECGMVTVDVRLGPAVKVRLRCYPDETVGGVKECLVTKSNTAKRGMTLCMDGDEIGPDDASLWECGVRCGTVLMEMKRREESVRVRQGEAVTRVAVTENDTGASLRKKISAKFNMPEVILSPDVPDSIKVRHVAPAVSVYTARPDVAAIERAKLTSEVASIHASLTTLARNTSDLQNTVYTLSHPTDPDPYLLPPGSPPTTALAHAVDSVTHVTSKLRNPPRVLDIVKR